MAEFDLKIVPDPRLPVHTSQQRRASSQAAPSVSEAASSAQVTLSRAARDLVGDGFSAGVDEAAAGVLAAYDLRCISYTDLVSLAGALKAVGALRDEDYLDFIGPSPEFASIDRRRDQDWNAPQDYVAKHQQQLRMLELTGAEQRFIDFEQRVLLLYAHFLTLQGHLQA